MTRNEQILRMVQRLPPDVTYDRVIYNLDLMKNVEASLDEIARGEALDHEDVVAEFAAPYEKDEDPVGAERKKKSSRSQPLRREKLAAEVSVEN